LRRRHSRTIALGDKRPVPARPVLVGQQDQVAVWRRAAGPAGLCQQHQREEALDLRLLGHQLAQHPRQPDRLRAQLADELIAGARGVPLVEDEIEDGEHRPQTAGEVGRIGHAVGDVGVADLVLGPHQSLRHGRLGDEEGVRDLGRRQAA